ncbi:MAG TPA: hypothetical protein VHP11_03555, partial [Tepidisphaeraceae bacterium]|nr:hypothetical protein [Tepidisphaeraceae bacterium]
QIHQQRCQMPLVQLIGYGAIPRTVPAAATPMGKQNHPRYDYNQIMYRLDLSDPRLPQPLKP